MQKTEPDVVYLSGRKSWRL